VSQAEPGRISLILPVGSPGQVIAATRIVIFLLRAVGRTELDLLEFRTAPRAQDTAVGVGGVLFASAAVSLRPGDAAARSRLERMVRHRVVREYARQGISPVEYDLELL
jgi:hypothetical protein